MLDIIVQVLTYKSFAVINSLFLILELPKPVGRSRFCTTWKGPIAVRCFQPRIIPSIREECDEHTEQRACRDVVNIMTIIFASRYCYQRRANKGCQGQQDSRKIRVWSKDVHLPSKNQCQISQPAESKAAVPARKTPPSIVENMMIGFGANVDRDQSMLCRIVPRLTS